MSFLLIIIHTPFKIMLKCKLKYLAKNVRGQGDSACTDRTGLNWFRKVQTKSSLYIELNQITQVNMRVNETGKNRQSQVISKRLREFGVH